MGEHLIEPHDRHRQDQHDPEQPAELTDVVSMVVVIVPSVTAVCFVPSVVLAFVPTVLTFMPIVVAMTGWVSAPIVMTTVLVVRIAVRCLM
ncbi:hypothetical protein I2485_03990 [Nesterenkonia sp. E16_7]|nr:hypothetical protein [Nesterenkonia sp. E16_10]MBO0597806.1 hypothetical protein [Nesterenkonia sp. E16_7]